MSEMTQTERECMWRAIDSYRRACGTPNLASDLILMARQAVEKAIEDIRAEAFAAGYLAREEETE